MRSDSEATRVANEVTRLEQELTRLLSPIQAAELSAGADRGRLDALADQLPAAWAETLPTLTAEAISRLSEERDGLAASRPDEAPARIDEDRTRRDGWAKRLEELASALAEIPPSARVPNAKAERATGRAKEDAEAADIARNGAKSAASTTCGVAPKNCGSWPRRSARPNVGTICTRGSRGTSAPPASCAIWYGRPSGRSPASRTRLCKNSPTAT